MTVGRWARHSASHQRNETDVHKKVTGGGKTPNKPGGQGASFKSQTEAQKRKNRDKGSGKLRTETRLTAAGQGGKCRGAWFGRRSQKKERRLKKKRASFGVRKAQKIDQTTRNGSGI